MLSLQNVSKTFDNQIAVSNLSFNLKKGETLGLVGQNGAGKSTTFKMILNFITPDSGKILFNKHKLSYKDLDFVGYMPEERGLYLDMTIEQQVVYFAELHNYPKSKTLQNLNYWMDKLSVKGNNKSKIKTLSKGNQQKVQLITSFIHQPRLLILDEPFSGLDPVNTENLITAIMELKKRGTTIIFSSHNMQNVEQVSDKVLMLVNGITKLNGSVNEIKDSFPKNRIYLEGNFNNDIINSFNGIKNVSPSYPGFILKFDTEKNARLAIQKLKSDYYDQTNGFKILLPSLDNIFKHVITQEGKNYEENIDCC
ncbi:ABC transporter ATP-binding protein [Ligilactobacillus cholophilus]|uniref:ABC transporter ATP-binding protein n=1 Tax=Ligilactobacillus cholophilus TaxID=3050131 RepID=UPI0025AEFFA8|nr:ATP-binding cassette domain-containing protein [Ligilactobacillus cholophilus]